MSIPNTYKVEPIEHIEIRDWLLNKHYAKRIPSVIHSFGLFDTGRLLQGVCCYGTPANNHNNMIGEYRVIELVRLVVNEGLPKNTLSYFVSETFKHLEKPLILISYADQGKNHHGYIYQATNWIYTGLGGGVDFYRTVDGIDIHSRIMSDLRLKEPNKTREQIATEKGWTKIKGTFKYRYFYALGDKRTKPKMIALINEKYPSQPYPKGENVRYDASYEPSVQTRLL
jgi:hypothetical protein